MNFTKRNHYNPCFWTALWNEEYYDKVSQGISDLPAARAQQVYALSVKANKILRQPVERVHYDKHLGVAEITQESAAEFAKRHHPEKYEEFSCQSAYAQYPVYIDFEDILTGIEGLPPYTVLRKVATTGNISTCEDKVFLGCFIVLQFLRSHAIMNSMVQWHETLSRPKFEHFVTLKWLLSDTEALFGAVHPLVDCRWTLYHTSSATFPLCDSPVLVQPESIMVALSPRVIVEIQRTVPADDGELCLVRRIPDSKIDEFRRRTIANTFREVIFGNLQVLQSWKESSEFQRRVDLMKDAQQYNKLVQDEGRRELWLLNAYANL